MRKSASSCFTMVTFTVVAPVRYGESVCLVGDVPALGSNDHTYGVKLVTTPDTFPAWFTPNPIPLIKGERINYRYALFSGGKFSDWEKQIDSHALVVAASSETQQVHDNLCMGGSQSQGYASSVNSERSFSPPGSPRASAHQRNLSAEAYAYGSSTGPRARRVWNRAANDPIIPYAPRDRRPKAQKIDVLDGVVIVQYFLPVKITRVTEAGSVDHAYAGDPGWKSRSDNLFLKNLALPESSGKIKSGIKLAARSFETRSRQVSLPRTTEGKSRRWKIEWDHNALLSRKKSSIADDMRVVFIGCPPISEPIQPYERRKLIDELRRFRCVPVFMNQDFHDMHQLYCEDVLRKLFHHQIDVYGPLPTRWWNTVNHENCWSGYRSANQAFADSVVEVYNERDIIWVHGYELLLLPSLLQRRLSAARPHIGLFMHSPFPSSEVFRTLSVRDDILRSMLNADEIGFHVFEYARPFISCCHRILNVQKRNFGFLDEDSVQGARGGLYIEYQGRMVCITVCHAGIEPSLVRSTFSAPSVTDTAQTIFEESLLRNGDESSSSDIRKNGSLKEALKQVILLGIDSMEEFSGIHFKLSAYEIFLKENPEWSDKLCLMQVCIERKNSKSSHFEFRKRVLQIARQINASHPRKPGLRPAVCLFTWPSCSFEDRLALFSLSDIYFNTPLRCGLDLSVFEFIVVADERRSLHGPWPSALGSMQSTLRSSDLKRFPLVILSEFVPCSRVLYSSLRCSTWSLGDMNRALSSALSMKVCERELRFKKALDYVQTHVASGWALRVLGDIKRAHRAYQGPEMAVDHRGGVLRATGLGLGLQFRAVEFRPDFNHLRDDELIHSYRMSVRRLIILDYGGTITSENDPAMQDEKHGDAAIFCRKLDVRLPSPQMIDVLRTLAQDPLNSVFIVSGHERQSLEIAFRDVPRIGLAAENGFFFSWSCKNDCERDPSWGVDTTETLTERRMRPASISESIYYGLSPVVMRDNFTSKRGEKSGDKADVNVNRVDCLPQSVSGPVFNSAKVVQPSDQPLWREWMTLSDHFDDDWIELSEQIMDVYTQRTYGTYIEKKESSLVWQYSDAEPEFGAMQANELQDHLHSVLSRFPINVVSGKGYIEVRPQGVDKGSACSHILDALFPDCNFPDFILCMGDDLTDEAMFDYFSGVCDYGDLENKQDDVQTSDLHTKLISCVVGEKPSHAKYFVNDVEEVFDKLRVLSRVSTKLEASRSLDNMLEASSTGFNRIGIYNDSDLPDLPFFNGNAMKNLGIEKRDEVSSDDQVQHQPTVQAIPNNSSASSASKLTSSAEGLNDADGEEANAIGFLPFSEAKALDASKRHKSFLDLDLGLASGRNCAVHGSTLVASASSPHLSSYFSLGISQPTSQSAQEYLDLIDDDNDEGIMF